MQGQLAQETSGQELWPQTGDILNAWQARKDHQSPALASKGNTAQQAGGTTIATDTEGKKLLLLPNRLSSFSRPALQQGRAMQECSGGTVGPSPAHPSLGSAPLPGAALGSGRAVIGLQLLLTHNPHRHHSQRDAPHQDTHSPGGTEGRAWSYIQLPTGTPGCRTTGSISTQV